MFSFALAGGFHWLTNLKFCIGILMDCCYYQLSYYRVYDLATLKS